MKKLLILIAFLTSIVGCSTNVEPVIQKVENANNTEENSEPELIAEVIEDDEEVIEYIDFFVDNELVRVNLKAIPILDNYLMGVNDKKIAVERMNLEKLPIGNQSIYLLEFSCQNNLCSYLLINQNEENQSYLLTDLAKYETTILSPDGLKFVIQFSRPSTYNFPLHHIVAIHLEAWKILTLQSDTDSENILQYTWPFVTVEWKDDSSISITKHNLIEFDEEENISWSEMQNNSTISIFTIE